MEGVRGEGAETAIAGLEGWREEGGRRVMEGVRRGEQRRVREEEARMGAEESESDPERVTRG